MTFFAPTGQDIKAQGKRSAALGNECSRGFSTLKGWDQPNAGLDATPSG